MVVYDFTLDFAFFQYGAILFTVIVLITITADPFKAHFKHLSSSLSVFILFIAVFYVCAIGVDMAVRRNDSTTTYVIFGFIYLYWSSSGSSSTVVVTEKDGINIMYGFL